VVVIFLALVAAFANAVASICQRLGVEDAPESHGPSLGLVRHMVRRRVWILGFVIMALGYGAQSGALHLGSLNEVQPLMVSELVMLVALLWLWYATALRARDLAAALATAVGLGAFLTISSPSTGSLVPGDARWLGVSTVVVAVIMLLVALGVRGPTWWRALSLGASASVGFALLAAITKSMTNILVAGWGPLLSSWQLYALCVIGLASFVIMQSAFQVGPFAASQSTLILLNPLVSLAIGRVLFGEHLRGGLLAVTFEILALALMVLGALGLSTSSLVNRVHDGAPDAHLLRGRGRYARWRHARANAATCTAPR
jgi:hypothetical protein